MKCPYSFSTVGQVSTYAYNIDGHMDLAAMQETRQFAECMEEECGAWQNGKCNYNQGQNFQ